MYRFNLLFRARCNFHGVEWDKNQKHSLKGSIITAAVFGKLKTQLDVSSEFAGVQEGANVQFASCTYATLEHETIRSFVRAPEAI
ncbi:hypothetical protein OUZ56_025426 [Daphnia magna]|uniref:Uncharacterized protein n=1 Tax=Daphnia magna TaxID=35525 RepID=A0ABQ9ZJT5_9CRUS|nr:hypothetical protein OUZ56_025426 [Daphnia magna]